MKKYFLLSVALMGSLYVNAQHTVYCEMLQFSPGSKSIISVDFGNKGTEEILNENGEKIKFNSSIDALAYFEKLGWSVNSVYSVEHKTGLANVPVVHYLLQKKVNDYSEKMNGIYTNKKDTK